VSSKLTYLLHGSSDKIPSGLPALHLAQRRYNLADENALNWLDTQNKGFKRNEHINIFSANFIRLRIALKNL